MYTSIMRDEEHAAQIRRVEREGLARHDAITRQLSPSQKVAVVHQLRRTAWEGKAAWLRARYPMLEEDEIQARVRAIFLRAVT
jgi:hypothetical protein